MSIARQSIVTVLLAALLATGARAAHAQGSLSAARDLYAAAAYDEALTALNALAAQGSAITESATVSLYRALCLYALNRNAEGDRAVEALVAQHPFYQAPMDELSPRMRTTVKETRRRMLPGFLQQKYAEAKTAYEQKDYGTAADGFTRVIEGIADPDLSGAANAPQLADLATLASGFRDLATKAMMPVPAPKPTVMLAAPVASVSAPKIYSPADAEAAPPVVIRQTIPAYNRLVVQRKTAVVEVLVDEHGTVESAVMLSPLDPSYDRAVITAAKNWMYKPAKVNGKPVKYQKRVQISLVPEEK
jgi:TonB family protein